VKTRWERYCELQAFDAWCLKHPRKAVLLGLSAGLVIFAAAQLLEHLPPGPLFVVGFTTTVFFLLRLAKR
jgi:hypothetical protein